MRGGAETLFLKEKKKKKVKKNSGHSATGEVEVSELGGVESAVEVYCHSNNGKPTEDS